MSQRQLQCVGLDGVDAKKAQMRVVALGEMIFNLQVVPGFHDWVIGLRSRDLTAAVAEIEVAKQLIKSGMQVRFMTPHGEKGSDYELDVELPSGDLASCEVKSKHIKTPLSERTVFKSIKKAARQTPPTRPAIIFLRLPEHWISDGQLNNAVEAAVDQLFHNYQRVIAVVFFWEEWLEITTGPLAHVWKFREYVNEKSRFYSEENGFLMRSMMMAPNSGQWVRFPDLFSAHHQPADDTTQNSSQ